MLILNKLILGIISKKNRIFVTEIILYCEEYVIDIFSIYMKKKNKVFTVHDFIIFLKAKIAIILLSTFLLSLVTIYFQVSYKDHWAVKLSRTVNKIALIQTITLIKKQEEVRAKKYDELPEKIDPINLMGDINGLITSAMINYLSNEDIEYTGLGNSTNENLLRKENYEFIISNKNSKDIEILKKNLATFIFDTNKLTKDIIKMQYELDPTYNMEIYNFKIKNIERIQGYDYEKIIKIVLINLIVSIFFIFIFHIRKVINLF